MKDARLFAVVAEDGRRDLSARIAVNARRVNVEIALHVLGQTPRWIRHVTSLKFKVQSSKAGHEQVGGVVNRPVDFGHAVTGNGERDATARAVDDADVDRDKKAYPRNHTKRHEIIQAIRAFSFVLLRVISWISSFRAPIS
jgi:hypothetical protein